MKSRFRGFSWSSGVLVSLFVYMFTPAPILAEADAACRPIFITWSTYPMPSAPTGLFAKDLNGDDRTDAISTSASDDSAVSVRLGQPDGSLGPPIVSDIGTLSFQAVLGAFDADSNLDLVVNGVFPLGFAKGNGDGTFEPITDAGPGGAGYLRAADFDGDGHLDLVGTYAQGFPAEFGIAVMLGNGDGTFQDPIFTPTIAGVTGLVVGSLDAGGAPDVVLASGEDFVAIYLGDGHGGFTDGGTITLGDSSRA